MLLKLSPVKIDASRGVFKLPEKLSKTHAVVNIDCDRAYFKHALLSVLHYNDMKKHRQHVSKHPA